jgi:uncharacterized iron-regulated membrane protein
LSLLVTVVGLTGSYIVYKPEMERLSAGRIATVQPGSAIRPLSELYRVAQSTTPKRIERLYIWGGPTAAWAFRASRGGLEREYVYVDQYRGRVQGVYPMDGTTLQWIYDLHGTILMGKGGLIANGIGALLLCLMCATGAVVWWPGAGRLRQGLRYRWRSKWQIQNYDLHKVLGIVTLAALVVIAFTGASYAFPQAYRQMFGAITRSSASVEHEAQSRMSRGAIAASLDNIFRSAEMAVPHAELTVLTWPVDAKGAFSARERLPGDWARLGDQYIFINQYTASVVRADLSRRLAPASRIMLTMSPLHYGTFAGTITRWIWLAMGLVPGLLSITGFLMWWNRVEARRLAALGRNSLLPAGTAAADQ